MTVENGVLERLILGEIEGKNRAIHAYDVMAHTGSGLSFFLERKVPLKTQPYNNLARDKRDQGLSSFRNTKRAIQ